MRRAVALGILATSLGSGCAATSEVDSIRREQRRLASQLADTRADVDSLRASVARLRGSVDESKRGSGAAGPGDVGALDQRVAILEERFGRMPASRVGTPVPGEAGADPLAGAPALNDPLGGAGGTPPPEAGAAAAPSAGEPAPRPLAPLAVPPVGAPAPAAGVAASTGPDGLKNVTVDQDLARGGSEEFTLGLQQYQRGEYPKAVQTLRAYVSKRPGVDNSARAQYWIGESYFAQRKYNEAILAFNEIVVNAPKSDRVPAALLRQAAAFSELGDKIDARLILQKLTAEHPNTEEAAKAKQKLLALGA